VPWQLVRALVLLAVLLRVVCCLLLVVRQVVLRLPVVLGVRLLLEVLTVLLLEGVLWLLETAWSFLVGLC
jgi:hypothetical protein